MKARIQFNEFKIDLESGLLLKELSDGQVQEIRLAPQPTKLLQLLLEAYPKVLSQEEIKQAIWPDTELGFEGSLHYCVRQLRQALEDSAAQPKFIETIPRRGYRWLVAWQVSSEYKEQLEKPTKKIGPLFLRLGMLLIILFCAIWFLSPTWQTNTKASDVPTRIAIMPLQPKSPDHLLANNQMAFQLLEKMDREMLHALEIIGPTTSSQYTSGQVRQMIQDYQLDGLINVNFLQRKEQEIALIEIIRATDGAHVWVKSYPVDWPQDSLVGIIYDGFLEALEAGLLEEN